MFYAPFLNLLQRVVSLQITPLSSTLTRLSSFISLSYSCWSYTYMTIFSPLTPCKIPLSFLYNYLVYLHTHNQALIFIFSKTILTIAFSPNLHFTTKKSPFLPFLYKHKSRSHDLLPERRQSPSIILYTCISNSYHITESLSTNLLRLLCNINIASANFPP